MMPLLRTLKIANSAILSYNPRISWRNGFRQEIGSPIMIYKKKKSFSRHKITLWDLLSAATLLVRVGQASHRSSRTVRRRVIPGTFRQPERQLSSHRGSNLSQSLRPEGKQKTNLGEFGGIADNLSGPKTLSKIVESFLAGYHSNRI